MTPATIAAQFQRVRANSIALCEPLELEDYGLQAMASTSPPKWHLAHTTWFFETFVLVPYIHNYQRWHPAFEHLFNSYYNGIGTPFSRPQRGLLSRPSVSEVMEYRRAIDERILTLLESSQTLGRNILETIELGLHHEQQHQELLLTDLKYSFHVNPLQPAYRASRRPAEVTQAEPEDPWVAFEGGVVEVGAEGQGFCFDNETPRHRQYLEPFCLAWRPVSNSDVLAFMADGGYQRPELWLADGWDLVQRERLTAPLYWQRSDNGWRHFTLAGQVPLVANQTACHLSYYEADAYARWAWARLPTEAEWEHAAKSQVVAGNFIDTGQCHPDVAVSSSPLAQLFGDVWEWTSSSYSPYPGYAPAAGAIGEYNGKFMCNQMVLRGGSCVSDRAHIRATYRNFFYPADRWQFSGLRLARSR
ncbi:MAG: hypothetical protein VR73_11290 [Gammaproteobacteria bacterium BRH_c0]|nr:MAG: hypothetical protein VR73_11290 [Gammaproteobacteria bacterium BRH_c0]